MLLWFPGGSKTCPTQRVIILRGKRKNSFQTSRRRSQTCRLELPGKGNLKLGSSAIKCGVFSGSAQKLEADFIFVLGRNKEMKENNSNPVNSLRYESHSLVISSCYFLSSRTHVPSKLILFFRRRVRLLWLSSFFFLQLEHFCNPGN